MAFIQNLHCDVCGMHQSHVDHRCQGCLAREARDKIEAWRAIPIEERMDDLRRRVEILENNSRRGVY